jgi:hypothetical protein
MFEKAKQEHRNSTGHCAGETLEHRQFGESRFIHSASPSDHRGGECLQQATAQNSADRTGKRMAERPEVVILHCDRSSMSTENTADDLNH